MHMTSLWPVLSMILVISVCKGHWEVINDISDVDTEDIDLIKEQLLPVDVPHKKVKKAPQTTLVTLKQNGSKKKSLGTTMKGQTPPQNHHHRVAAVTPSTKKVTEKQNIKSPAAMTQTSPRDSSGKHDGTTRSSGSSQKSKTVKSDDDIDLASEGFLVVEDKKVLHSPNSRKLTQYIEHFSEDFPPSLRHGKSSSVLLSSEDGGPYRTNEEATSSTKPIDLSQIPSQQRKPHHQPLQQPVKEQAVIGNGQLPPFRVKDGMDVDLYIKQACIEEDSWECLMLSEDYQNMTGDTTLFRTPSANERARRQASSNIESSVATGVLGCEQGDCLSGNGTDPDEEEVVPEFTIKYNIRFRTNRTEADLDDRTRQDIANLLQDQIADIFKDVPGFKNVSIHPGKIRIDSEGTLIVSWLVAIDGGNPIFSGMNGKEVRDTIEGPLRNVSEAYMSVFGVDGQHPSNHFNFSQAADQVERQARDPCKMRPSPCSVGFGSCKRLPNCGRGIELRCINNCKTFGNCHNNGTCEKDVTGAAFCQCAQNWIGPYCHKQNDSLAPADQTTAPDYRFNSTSTFHTNFTPEDLTYLMRIEIVNNLTMQLHDILKTYLPGFLNVTADPNSIRIVDGNLVIDWQVSLSSRPYNGKSPDEIADVVRDALKDLADIYKKGVVIVDQKPSEDFDYIDAADQVENSASDPCSNNPCSPGYSFCRALSTTLVMCLHKCNIAGQCNNGGTCHLNSTHDAECQCARQWTGPHCDTQNVNLDGGAITGIILGSILIAAGVIGCCWWLLCARRRRRRRKRKRSDVVSPKYRDLESFGTFSDASSKLCVIDRPMVSVSPLPIFEPSSYVPPPPSTTSNNVSTFRSFSQRSTFGPARSSAGPSKGNNPFINYYS